MKSGGLCLQWIFWMILFLPAVAVADTQYIILTQTPCQFVEAEDQDWHFTAHSASDCERINAQTAVSRLQHATVLTLKPGHYVFRVYNKNVSYPLGFWLRGAGMSRLTLPSVSGGGILAGTHRDYPVELREGEYRYSCPLNPTPDYILIVRE